MLRCALKRRLGPRAVERLGARRGQSPLGDLLLSSEPSQGLSGNTVFQSCFMSTVEPFAFASSHALSSSPILRGGRMRIRAPFPSPVVSLRRHSFEFAEPFHRILLPQQRVVDAAGIERTAGLIRKLLEVAEELLDLPWIGTSNQIFRARKSIAPPPSSRPFS
jgi:hypothetical protein